MMFSRFFSATCLTMLALGLLALAPAQAAEMPGLYRAAVPVLSRDDVSERQRAFRSALEEVLVKLTGRADIAQQPGLAEALRNAQPYVESFSYRSVTTGGEAAAIESTGGAQDRMQLLLETDFYRSQIETLLESARVPLWPPNRPDTLLWLAVQEASGQRSLASIGGPGSTWLTQLQEVAQHKGLPLLLPVLDLEDRRALRPELLWSFDLDALRSASARYQVESILAVRLYSLPGGQVFARAVHLFRDQVLELDAVEVPAQGFLEDSIAMVAAELSAHYAILLSGVSTSASAQNAAQLVVSGIDSVADYASLLDYLNRLTVVQAVQVREVAGGRIVLELATGGQLRQLIEVLALDRRILPLAQAERDNLQLNLQYQWQAD
ncbi:MAG TPA: DUF2066 domain-containing protein [Pseudomonadaceae bacterium]|nr:DUF2066 domain-containing protein [Pseudomonadaceae bacterium]